MNLKAGTQFRSEVPFVHILANSERGTRCDECFFCSDTLRCSGCRFARFCSVSCQKKAWVLHKVECKCIKRVAPKIPTDSAWLLFRLIQRYMAGDHRIKFPSRSKKKRCFWDLMSHTKEIREDSRRTEQFTQILQTLKTFAAEDFNLPSAEEILEIFGKMTVNTFSICDAEMRPIGAGVYINSSIVDHSCRPNAVATFSGTQLQIRFIENVSITDMESQVRISYIDELASVIERQRQLQEQYYFTCDCDMCGNSELELLMNSSCCTSPGCMEPIFEENDRFIPCRKCGIEIENTDYKVKKEHAQSFSQTAVKEIDQLKKSYDSKKILKLCEECLKRQQDILHPFNVNHVHILDQAFDACINLQLWDEAVTYGTQTLEPYRKYYHSNHPNVGIQCMKIAKIQLYLQQYGNALKHFEKAESIISVTHGTDHTLYMELKSLILQAREEMNELSS